MIIWWVYHFDIKLLLCVFVALLLRILVIILLSLITFCRLVQYPKTPFHKRYEYPHKGRIIHRVHYLLTTRLIVFIKIERSQTDILLLHRLWIIFIHPLHSTNFIKHDNMLSGEDDISYYSVTLVIIVDLDVTT